MSNVSLLDCPIEILHHIFDYLDTQTIFRSLRCVCNQLDATVKTYNRFQLNLTLTSQLHFDFILHFFRPENIISLVYSADCSKQSNKIDFLLTNFDIRQCTRLNSLTQLDIDNTELDRVLLLISLSIQFYHPSHRVPILSLSKAIMKWNLQQLHLINESYITTILSWPIPCPLNHLTIDTCTYTEFMYILGHSPFLRTFTMKNCIGMNSAHSIDVSYPQLTSLIINFCYLSFKNLNLLLSYIPSITYLKLIIYEAELGSLFDGSQWEEFIQTKLPFLNKFHFCFRYTIQKNYEKYISIDSVINQYRTPFWLKKKTLVCYL
ncbi:unnamed protein product [Adineta steineri]|uniref:F-box domain-containing protein n=1 Tax=Adineta steineri TaxID=433720 RepID=A0A815KL65_9BILA|nr:unnamed protein product [Adineta steineri]